MIFRFWWFCLDDDAALSSRRSLFLKKQEGKTEKVKKLAFTKPANKEFPSLGKFNEWEMVSSDVITIDDEFLKESESKTWADMAADKANDVCLGSTRGSSVCETDSIMT